MSNIHQINDLQHHNASRVILSAGDAATDYNPILWIIDKLKQSPIGEKDEIDAEMPDPITWIKNGMRACRNYHSLVFRRTSHMSHEVRDGVHWVGSKLLFPLSFCKIGRALQYALSYSVLGSIAQTIVFCATQVFHFLPYMIATSLAASALTLYRTDPIALTAICAGGMLTTQLFFIYRLVKTVDAVKKTFEQKADDLISAINLVQLAKNTVWSALSHTARGLRWTVSWIPIGNPTN